MSQRIAKLTCALVIERARRGLHLLFDVLHHLIRSALEKQHHLIDHRSVLHLTLRENARRLAAMDVIIETRSLGHLARHVVVARAHCEDSLHDIERAPHRSDVGVRSEVSSAVIQKSARDINTRKRFLNCDLDVRIRLIVAKRDVEPRLVLLDEIRLEYQRMRLAGHHDRLDVGDLADEVASFRIVGVIGAEIAPHAGAETLCLPHIKSFPLLVFPEIHSGAIGQVG